MSAQPRLVFATRNQGKVVELRALLADLDLVVLSLDEVDQSVSEVDEDGDTFVANAIKKARTISRELALPALADDSGLEVDALGGAPGVISARYSADLGEPTDRSNNEKLLAALAGVPAPERTARFRSSLAFADVAGVLGDRVLTCDGTCEGTVLVEGRGTGGFGYDPLFYVPELQATFAELGIGTKNDSSHRARAMRAMKPLIADYFGL